MREQQQTYDRTPPVLVPFSGTAAYWQEELAVLDLMITFTLEYKSEVLGENPYDPMKGMVVTEDEIYRILYAPYTEVPPMPENLQALLEVCRSRRHNIREKLKLEKSSKTKGRPPLPIVRLIEAYNLTEFEYSCVVLAIAAELDRKYEKLFGYLQDDITCKRPTADLALKLFASGLEGKTSALRSLASGARFRSALLNDSSWTSAVSVLAAPLQLDQRIVSWLLETESFDSRLEGAVLKIGAGQHPERLLFGEKHFGALLRSIRRFHERSNETDKSNVNPVCCLHLWGEEGAGKKLQVHHTAYALNKPLLVLDASKAGNDLEKSGTLMTCLFREAVLSGALIAIDKADAWIQQFEDQPVHWTRIEQGMKEAGGIYFWLTERYFRPASLPLWEESGCFAAEVALPVPEERERLWQNLLEKLSLSSGAAGLADQLAGKYPVTPGRIKSGLLQALKLADWEDAPVLDLKHLDQGMLSQTAHQLKEKAKKLKPHYRLKDLILPEDQMDMLQQACAFMAYKRKVFGGWGLSRRLSYGKGLSLLYAGPPGTGKTMAAEALSNELGLEVYKIDLSQMVSKYIGETEKNLNDLYAEAQKTNAILFFDEADALFGKRSEVKDAHDKYANTETAYLLQKMEEYEGVSILATNFLQNIDEAFLRRLNYVIKFPFPDAAQRERLWLSMIPEEMPVDEDVEFGLLAAELELAGGNIKNIVVTAAFMAASADQPLAMKHLIKAAGQELTKSGKLIPAGLYELI